MLFHIPDEMPDACAGVGARTFVMDIAKGAFNRIGLGAISRQIQQLEAGMRSPPRLDFLGLMQLGVIDHDRQVGKERGGVGPIERVQQLKKQPGLFALPHTMGDCSCSQVQGAGQRALRVGARRQHLHLFAFGHPLITDLG